MSGQCKEIEESREFFKKIGDTEGTFQAKIGTVNDRNNKDPTEAEEMKKR